MIIYSDDMLDNELLNKESTITSSGEKIKTPILVRYIV